MVGLYNSNSFGINKLSTASNTKADASSNQGGGGGGNFYQGDPEAYDNNSYSDHYDSDDSNQVIINTPFNPNNIEHLDPSQIEKLISFQNSLEEIEKNLEEEDDQDNEEYNEESIDDTATIRIQKVTANDQSAQRNGG